MNHHVPTWILKEMEQNEEQQPRYHEYIRQKLRELTEDERQASIQREKANKAGCTCGSIGGPSGDDWCKYCLDVE